MAVLGLLTAGAGALGAISNIIGGGKESKRRKRAAERAATLQGQAIAEEKRRFDLGNPFRQAALEALERLRGGFEIQDSPFFQFRKKEETQALRGQLAASGGLRGGRGLRAISDLTRSLTGEETERQIGQEFGIAQLGAQFFSPAQATFDPSGQASAVLAGGRSGQPLTSAIQGEAAGLPFLIAELMKLRGGGGGGRGSLFGGGGGRGAETLSLIGGR